MNTNNPTDPSETDQLFTVVLARLSMIEAVLMLLWRNHPNREAVKSAAALIVEVRETSGLNEPISELARVIQSDARKLSFDAIFPEYPPMSDGDQGRTA